MTNIIKQKSDEDHRARKPTGKRRSSILPDETKSMDRARRLLEQKGHRRQAKVNEREHHDDIGLSAEGAQQNNILQHEWLDNQRFDGIDPNLNPEPPLNSEARREFDNLKREQEMEKQLRKELKLGASPKYATAPKPRQGP